MECPSFKLPYFGCFVCQVRDHAHRHVLLVVVFPQAFLQNKEKEIMCVSEQLEAQLAGMGSGALREVGLSWRSMQPPVARQV